MRAIVFDVEANGAQPPRVCQLAYIMYGDGFEPIKAKNFYMRVDEMNKYAYRVHGLSVEALRSLSKGRRFEDYAEEIRADFYWADVYIGHGVAGDIDYLRREFDLIGVPMPVRTRYCTMKSFKGCCGKTADGQIKMPRLSELWEYFGIEKYQISAEARRLFGGGRTPHDARFDAAATYLAVRSAAERGINVPGAVINED